MSIRSRVSLTLAGASALLAAAACGPKTHPRPARPASDSIEVGYGAQPKDKVTGSITTLSQDDVTTRPLRIEELLRARVPGLQVLRNGTTISFRIRGTSSLIADQEPLVIVDNEMIQTGNIANALAGLTPDDIRGVTVLKDVASTSVYGQRGAGGVIVITTKGKKE